MDRIAAKFVEANGNLELLIAARAAGTSGITPEQEQIIFDAIEAFDNKIKSALPVPPVV